jgi:plastocyanin
VRRKALPLITVLTLAGAACGGGGIVVRSGPTEDVFVPQVVDFEDAAGRGVSLAIDADGNPHLAYLAFESKAPGGTPKQEDPNAPKLPAVRHAHLIQGLWTRSVVADDQKGLGGGDETAIVVDGEGVHHVAWTEEDALYYSNNAGGAEFSKPEEVASDVLGGVSLIAEPGAGVAISFLQAGAEAGSLVRVAFHRAGGWAVQTAAEAGRGHQSGTAIGFVGSAILVAYGDSGRTMVAGSSGATWSSEVVDERGGIGVSIDVDKQRNPHLAYSTSEGQVKHAHSISGGPWEVSQVGDGADGPTSIAVDDQGVHHVAWQTRAGLSYASNEGGEFRPEEVPGTESAELPRIGAGAQGTVYLAWFEPRGSGLVLSIRSDREPLLAVPQPSPTGVQPTGQPTGPPPCEPSGTTLTIAAPPGAIGTGFDQTCLAAPAGEAFTVEFTNDDSTVHNWALYADESASEHLGGGTPGEPIPAGESTTYEVDPIDEPGQFFYRCDFHPTTMTGTFVVQ